MPRRRAFPSREFVQKAAALCVAGGLLAVGDGTFWVRHSGGSSDPRFFAAAQAGEDDDSHHSKPPVNRDDASKAGTPHHDAPPQHNGGHTGNGEGKHHQSSHGEGIPLGPHQTLSYDANRNMLKLHVKLGERQDGPLRSATRDRARQDGAAWNLGSPHSGVPGEAANAYIRNIAGDREKEGRTVEALDRSVTPVAARYQSSMFERSSATTVMSKTKLPIGLPTSVPNQVLAVGMDPASVARAEALGFQADSLMNSEAGDHSIVRFTVPSGLDAARGQELLSQAMPGQRFELNKVYRLYRATAREEPVTLDKSLPPTAPGSTPTCAANRCFAREVIGWKDTLAPCARGLKVGVIDTDIDESHPAFEGRRIHRFDFSPEARSPAPNWHGTAVLSLLAGSPITNTPGLIPDAEFFAANIFHTDERGEMAADTISLLKALDWMRSFDVKIINMSFSGPRDGLVADAIERMSESGVVFVAAAGNEGPTAEPSYPAAYPQVIAVTAVTKDLHNYRYANRGYHIDIAAPGVDIWTATPGGRAGYHTGTSFAAPHVTAVLAVEPPETLKQSKADLLDDLAVMDLGQEGRDPIYGRGLLLAPSECTPPETTETVASAAE